MVTETPGSPRHRRRLLRIFLVLFVLVLLSFTYFSFLLSSSQDLDINLTRCLRTNVNLSEMRKGSMRERKLFIKKFSQLDNFYLFSGEV